MNKAILVWNITKDPEIRMTESGKTVATSAIATNEFYKDQSGEKKQQTEFHNLTAFWKTAELFENYIKKGQKILIEGKIKTRSWEGDDGKKRYSTYIAVDKVEFLGGNKKDELTEEDAEEVFDTPTAAVKKSTPKKEEEISIEDIPF